MSIVSLSVDIHSGNNALTSEPQAEAARLLREVADKIESGREGSTRPLRDINGGRVGSWSFGITDDEDADQE